VGSIAAALQTSLKAATEEAEAIKKAASVWR